MKIFEIEQGNTKRGIAVATASAVLLVISKKCNFQAVKHCRDMSTNRLKGVKV
jgi:hypothetical protein